MSGLFQGASCLLAGFRIIFRPGLRIFVVIPLLINTLLFSGLIYFGAQYFDGLMESLIPESLGWLEFLVWPVLAVSAIVVSFYTFTLVANLLGAPFNDRLSEKVAQLMGAELPGENDNSLIGDITTSILGELRKWLYFLGLMAIVLLAWLIPLTAFLAPFLWLVLSAWMMSVEYGDYPLANAGLIRFAERKAWLRQRRWQALGFGAATLGATMIPVVNFAVMPAAVAGATILWRRYDATHGQKKSTNPA